MVSSSRANSRASRQVVAWATRTRPRNLSRSGQAPGRGRCSAGAAGLLAAEAEHPDRQTSTSASGSTMLTMRKLFSTRARLTCSAATGRRARSSSPASMVALSGLPDGHLDGGQVAFQGRRLAGGDAEHQFEQGEGQPGVEMDQAAGLEQRHGVDAHRPLGSPLSGSREGADQDLLARRGEGAAGHWSRLTPRLQAKVSRTMSKLGSRLSPLSAARS